MGHADGIAGLCGEQWRSDSLDNHSSVQTIAASYLCVYMYICNSDIQIQK